MLYCILYSMHNTTISVCPSVRHVVVLNLNECTYCLFPQSGRAIIVVSRAPPPLQKSKGNPTSGVLNTRGRKFCDFLDKNRCYSQKRYEIGPYGYNMHVADRSVSVPMTLSDLQKRNATTHFSRRIIMRMLVPFDIKRPTLA